MKERKYFVNFIILVLLSYSLTFLATEWVQIRTHESLFLDDGTEEGMACEFTSIVKDTSELEGLEAENYILLLDLGKLNKWIYTISESKIREEFLREETFELLQTKEKLSVQTFLSSDKKKIIKYKLKSYPNQHIKEIDFGEVAKANGKFDKFIFDNFSKTFVDYLEKLRKLSFLAYNKEVYFSVRPSSFKVIWGSSKETEGPFVLQKYSHLKSISAIHYPILVHYNCDFDAQFGYPCTPEEVPSKNPKVLVIEKKQ
ncbi:MAG: hypothetical protein ACE14Q_01465 [Acidobacteriota bacterium]